MMVLLPHVSFPGSLLGSLPCPAVRMREVPCFCTCLTSGLTVNPSSSGTEMHSRGDSWGHGRWKEEQSQERRHRAQLRDSSWRGMWCAWHVGFPMGEGALEIITGRYRLISPFCPGPVLVLSFSLKCSTNQCGLQNFSVAGPQGWQVAGHGGLRQPYFVATFAQEARCFCFDYMIVWVLGATDGGCITKPYPTLKRQLMTSFFQDILCWKLS